MSATILLVDDDAEIRELLELLLTGEGYAILQADSGEAALELLGKGASVDLIILDVMMPGLSGYKTCARIRETSNVPILFLTARGMDTDLTLGFSAGGDDYLSKPFSNAELLSRVKALLRRYHVYGGKEEAADTGCLTAHGLRVAGVNPERELVEAVELTGHPWFVGVQFHPEFKSRPNRPHPLFIGLVGAAIRRAEEEACWKE